MPFTSLTGLKDRWRERLDESARGSDVPAGIDRGAAAVAPTGSRERGRLRRRLRELRRLREAQLLELGALVLEAHKHGREGSPVIKSKAAEAVATDAETRAVAEALDTSSGLDTIVTAGIAGPCPTCGTLASTAARFCSTCGTPLDGRPNAVPRADRAEAPDTPALDARAADADGHDADVVGAAPDTPARPTDALAADPDTAARATTEVPAANGNGAPPGELEATSGRES